MIKSLVTLIQVYYIRCINLVKYLLDRCLRIYDTVEFNQFIFPWSGKFCWDYYWNLIKQHMWGGPDKCSLLSAINGQNNILHEFKFQLEIFLTMQLRNNLKRSSRRLDRSSTSGWNTFNRSFHIKYVEWISFQCDREIHVSFQTQLAEFILGQWPPSDTS